jgi:putative transposase
MAFQNGRRSARCATGGRPGDLSGARVQRLDRRFRVLVIAHLVNEVLQRPVESTQYLAIRYTERLIEAGIESSVGSRGDAYDNALAETINGLYKTEVIHHLGPWKGLEEVEYATLEWVAWYNSERLMEPLGYLPPAEYEEQFHRARTGIAVPALN